LSSRSVKNKRRRKHCNAADSQACFTDDAALSQIYCKEAITVSEDFGGNFVTIEDEDGNEIELEHLDTALFGDNEYMAFIPAGADDDSEEVDFIILRVDEDEDDDPMLVTVEDEEELEKVYEVFMKRLEAREESEDDE